jgi:hypothetical protein
VHWRTQLCADALDALSENRGVRLLFFNRAADIAQMLAESVSRTGGHSEQNASPLKPSKNSLFL